MLVIYAFRVGIVAVHAQKLDYLLCRSSTKYVVVYIYNFHYITINKLKII